MQIPIGSKAEVRANLTLISKELRRDYHKVYQKWYKLTNGFYVRRGKDDAKEYLRVNEKAYKRKKRITKRVRKKMYKETPKPIAVKTEVAKTSKVKLTNKRVVVRDFVNVVVKGRSVIITYNN